MGVSWPLVFGAALHWASVLFQGVEFLPSLVSPVDASMVISPISAAAAIVFALLSSRLGNARVRGSIAGACIVAGFACFGLTFCIPESGSPTFAAFLIAFKLLATVNIVIPVLLWGYAFASLDKRTAGYNAVYTALVSFALALAMALVSMKFPGAGERLNILARCVSGLILIKGDVYFPESEDVALKDINKPLMMRFYGGRVLMGAAIGTLLAAVPGDGASPVLMLFEIAACIGLLCFLNTKGRGLVCEMVPVVPVVLAALLWFPFVCAGEGTYVSTGFLVIWLSWLFVSSFQLSGLKETLGLSGAFLSASEKAALLAGWSLGLYAGKLAVPPEAMGALSFVAVALTLVWACASSLRTVYSRQENDFADRANRKRADVEARVLSELRERFGLTEREAQIALMLAQGYSRPGICSQLGISNGTARAHSSHIYNKLGIHKRDELIVAVQEVERGLEAVV